VGQIHFVPVVILAEQSLGFIIMFVMDLALLAVIKSLEQPVQVKEII